jgi:hypothetical protein
VQYIVAEAGKLAAEPATKPTERADPCRALELKLLKETRGEGGLSAIFALRLEPFWAVRILA